MEKILVATYPFGATGKKPREILAETGWQIVYNPYNRRLKADEVKNLIEDVDGVIAGTEPYTKEIIESSKKLRVISRVGIGLDNVDLKACDENNIVVTYTPDAPSQAVAELTVAQILNLARSITQSDRSVRENAWNRYIGSLLSELTIGVIGVGRIGKRVIKLLQPFQPRILACDLVPDINFSSSCSMTWVDKHAIFSQSDVITLHIPLNKKNYHFIGRDEIAEIKTGTFLVNTSRGPTVDEKALVDALNQGHLGGAALDVFEKEPYDGPLAKMENVALTAHIGASARASRYAMELGAAEDCIRVLFGKSPLNPAPPEE